MKKILLSGLIISSLVFNGCSNKVSANMNSATPAEAETKVTSATDIEFVLLEDTETGHSFAISTAEITNEQYVKYLNAAYEENKIIYNASKGEVETLDGYTMIQLSGSRVVKDHNKDGVYAIDEMENPLNRCYIEYNETSDSFELVDPATVDWTQYFDSNLYPNVVDDITDWAELNNGEGQFYGNGDEDKLLPTLEEIKKWPVTFIRYYGASEFANYYGYDLPTRDEWIFAAKGGEDFSYATNDGELTDNSAWYNAEGPKNIHKGHAQAYDSLEANPYGIYNLGGNVWEWTKEWAEWTAPAEGVVGFGTIDRFYIDDEQRDPKIDPNGSDDTNNQYKKSLIGGSFNYFSATMAVTCTEGIKGPTMNLNSEGVWEHAAFIHAGNDHFGFRVVRSPSDINSLSTSEVTETTGEISSQLPDSINMIYINGATFSMGSDTLKGSPKQRESALVHDVTLSSYSMSESEVTNEQYVEFLNSAYKSGLIEINLGTQGPLQNKRLVQGTSNSAYEGKTLYNLDGIRVLKDHDNGDGDNNPFTGSVEPENPLNTSYIGFDETLGVFYVKNPYNSDDFNWYELCNYSDYTSSKGELESTVLNDFEDWSGGGQGLSSELEGWTVENPNGASNLPTLEEVKKWPVTFIQWWGAEAFAQFYSASLPTEAQWEYAAKTDQNFEYAVYDGKDTLDANWNQSSGVVALGHVRAAISGNPNPFGFYNLGGNAWEWIADNYVDEYDTENNIDPLVEVEGSTTRCWRGGSWNYHEATLQSSIRFSDDETHGNDHFGFRIVINH